MKLNESKEMWVVEDRWQHIHLFTLDYNIEDVKNKYQEDERGLWADYGWQCIPVNVLITPKEVTK